MFSLRIVNVDSYQSAPTKGYDICYSEFRGCEVYKVPIIRIFGITPAGQKGCLHVHGVFPYFSIRCKDVFPNIEAKSLRKYMQELAMDIDKALNVASRNSNSHRQHVYKIVVTEHIPFYGFHEKSEEFLKIYFYNPFDISRTAELMTNGVILNKFIQPYEAHISYILQFFIDYNLFGMNLINVSKFKFRAAEDDLIISPISPLRNQSLSHILDESSNALNKVWNIGTLSSSQISSLPRQTVCELEADCCSSEIMNRLSESFSSGKNPGLLAIWEEEKQRRKAENDTSMITPVPSQERADFIETESENFFKKKLRKILESVDGFKIIPKEKNEHTSKDLDMLSNSLDLSTSQDEDLLNMILSMANSQSTQLDDDSVLGLDHQNDMQSESIEEETREMSQLFTGELEELWSSQMTSDDSSRDRNDSDAFINTVIERSVLADENAIIPQLDGAFDDQDFNPKNKQSRKAEKKPVRDISEESLIKSCNLLQPVVQLTQSVIVKTEVLSPAVSRPESDTYSEFMDEDSSLSCNTPKGNSFPICVPVSRNARCSLIMNIYENSNDVSIEHTCSSRSNAELDSFADAEDPANVVFEILTNLVYKVECITEGKTSCYEHLTEEYQGKSCSDILYQGLSTEEKNTISQIKATASDYEEKPCIVKKDHCNEQHLSLPIKKRIFRNDQCDSCSHSLAMDFSKIGKEVVLLRKLSESDFKNHVNLDSLKVVIPPLPLHSVSSLTGSVRIDDSFEEKSKAPAEKDSSISQENTLESKDTNHNVNNYLSTVETETGSEVDNNSSVCTPSVIHQAPLLSAAKDTELNSTQSYNCENSNISIECGTNNCDISITHDTDNCDSSKNSNGKISCDTECSVHDDNKIETTILKDCDSEISPNPVVEQTSNAAHGTSVDNMDYTVKANITEGLDTDSANHKSSDDSTDIKVEAPIPNPKVVTDNTKDETINSLDCESKKVDDKAFDDERKCPTMSELRLYRRKKSMFGRGSLHQDVPDRNNKFLSSSTRLTRDSASKCMPVVQLEPCKDLIDRYCKSESPDSDCLILGEISHEPKTPPVMKEKRFFRSRARHLRSQNLSSNIIINHTLGLNGSKFRNKRFAPSKRGKPNISGPSTNRPNLRKRAANFDSPDKKKLPHPHSNYVSEKNALDKKLEQVYDFESHLNADDYEQLDRSFSTYSLVNKSFTSTLKRSVSGKLSLKLNRKRFNRPPIDPVPVYDVPDNNDLLDKQPTRTRPTRRASASVICYNEDHFQTTKDNQFLNKRLKKNTSENVSTEEIVIPNKSEETKNEDNFNWCIDDIPISQLKDVHSLKCTISKKKINYENNLQEVERLPIPKFKVRKKSSSNPLNVSIKLKKSSFGFINNDADFKVKEKFSEHSMNRKSHKKNSKSRKRSQALTSALDVKHKYKKCKESKKEALKNAIWQYCKSPSNNKITISSSKNNIQEVGHWKKKLNFCETNSPSLSSYNSNSTPRDEISSDISNLSPFTEDNSDDSKRSKSSLKMKLKLKRILTRSNEERIVVVGKELEGIETDSDANEAKQISGEDHASNRSNMSKEKNCKKVLGAKLINSQGDDFKLKSKFKSPLMIENKKVEKPVIEIQKCLTEDNMVRENSKSEENNKFKEKIPKFKYKPLLANISKDLLSVNVDSSATTGVQNSVSPKLEPSFTIISPKKKSPMKSAELIKKELAYLNEMICTTNTYTNFDSDLKSSDRVMADLKYAELPSNCKKTKDSSEEEIRDIIADDIHLSPTHSRLRERKHSTGCSKIPSRRNSLRNQDFKKYFDSDNEDNALNSKEIISSDVKCQDKLNIMIPDLYSMCKPCTVQLQKLSSFEIEKYIHKHLFAVHNTENLTVFDPLIATFPSPVVDSKSADSYIDPKKVFENLFEFSSPSQSPLNYNPFEASNLVIGNDISVGPFSNENSEHSRKESFKLTANPLNPLKPSDVFKSVERNDMGVLWNLSYFSPPQLNIPEKSFTQRKNLHIFDQKENSVELDDLQKLASRVNQLCSKSYNLLESESENSMSLLNEKNTKYNCSNKETKISFENILEGNTMKSFHNETEPSFSQTPTEFEIRHINDKSENFEFNCSEEIAKVIKEEPKSDQDHVFEPAESLPNVRILDFQECLVESDSEMNPLLNDSEIDSVISSADMILSNSVDKTHFEQCMQTELPLDDPSLDMQDELKCASEEPKSDQIDEVLTKVDIDCSLQKELDADLTCNNAIITAADTSSLLIPSYKNNTIPVLAINNPNQDGSVSITTFEEQNFAANGQFFPVMLAPVSVTDNENYLENSTTTMKETTSGAPECVNFLEDNELLQSCSVSSTSDIENKNTQASNALGIPFNGEEDILSMIVKSCDIGEEFDVNMNSAEENEGESISSATLCNVDSNYVMSGSNFIISSQPDQNTFTNSENAVSSSSENNLIPKSTEIVVIKTEPIDVPNVEQIVYEIQDKSHTLNHVSKNAKSDELANEENVLLDSMIHSFYGDDSLYGLHSSANSDNLSLLCSTFQNSNSFSQQSTEKFTECSPASLTTSVIKTADVSLEDGSYKSDSYFKNISIPQTKFLNENDSVQYRNIAVNDKVPLGLVQNSILVPPSKISSKRFHFTPSNKPPSRDLIKASEINSEHEQGVKLINLTEEDSLGSEHSMSSPISTNDGALPNVFNKALNDSECVGSQNFHSVTKNIPHHDGKTVIQSPVIYHEKNIGNFPFANNLISTPSTSNIKKEFPLPDIVVSPINKDPELTADTNKRKRRLVFEDDQTGSQKIFKPGRENTVTLFNKYSRNNSVNQSGDSLGNLSFSQLDGPTLENSRGFKVGSDNYSDARVRHEVQHLTIMSLENHVCTRNDLRPDPKFDPVTAIFYCIYNDNGNNEEEEIVGMIVVDPLSHHQSSGQNSSEILKNYLLLCPGVKNGFIYCVDNEISLFEKLVSVIKEWDPDILVGYEIQMSSWGYLVERADVLNINLRLLLSRLIDKNETKILPIEHDPTITDQTADLSRLNIIGRIVLCVWRLMRKEITLNVYSFENVYYHVLHKRTPLYAYHDLTNWFLGSQKEKVIRYFVIRVQGCIHLLEKLDVIGRTSELARLFGIQFYEVLSRGSQFRVESMMLRTAAPMSYIPVSPSVRQRSHSRAPECIPLILEPESRFYIDPVVVLDFQSLYPSMIIAYNYCFSTCLGRVEHFGKNVPFEFGCTSLNVPTALLQKLQNDIHISPTGIAFAKSSVRRGILPSMLEEILNTRIMVKQSMKKIKEKNALKRLLDARQMGLKLIANVTYGYTGASFSGRMPSVEVADSIVGKGRETLERAIHMIENTSKWRAKVIYGDTDSLFILLPGRSKKQAFEIGQEIADAVTADNPKPVKLKFEKVYLPCILQTKKRYVGFMYETVDQENPVFDAKGIETVRRDSCPATAKILEKSLKILFKSYDVTLVKNYVQKQFTKLLSGRVSIIDYVFAKEYRGISGYRPGACVPALEIAKKRLAKDPRSEPRVGERVPYVVVYGFPGVPIIQLVREPIELLRDLNLRINSSYYITRVISPPLERVFNLLGADVKSWYTNLARTFKPTLPMTRPTNQHRGTLSQYFVTLSCPSCEKPTFSTVCDDCREDLQGTTITLNEKIRQWERTVDHLTQICGSCTKSGSSIDSCVSLDCPMLFKLNAAKKDLSQAPYLRKVLAHELF